MVTKRSGSRALALVRARERTYRRSPRRHRLLCVPAEDPRQEHLRDIHHVAEFDRLEIQHFFEVYKDLEPGKSVEGAMWVGRAEAEAEVTRSRDRYATAIASGEYHDPGVAPIIPSRPSTRSDNNS